MNNTMENVFLRHYNIPERILDFYDKRLNFNWIVGDRRFTPRCRVGSSAEYWYFSKKAYLTDYVVSTSVTLLPYIVGFTCAILLLCFCSYYEKKSPYFSYSIFSGWTVLYALIFIFFLFSNGFPWSRLGLNGSIFMNSYVTELQLLIALFSIVAVLIALPYVQKTRQNTHEFFVLMLISCLGMVALVSAQTLLMLYLCIELQALCFYVLASYKRQSLISVEAGLKYFSLSAMASGMLLAGFTMIYYATGSISLMDIKLVLAGACSVSDLSQVQGFLAIITIGLLFVLSAFFFKLPAAPFHMWAADVYEGSPTASTAYFLSVPKFAILGTLFGLLYQVFSPLFLVFQPVILVISVVSLLIGYFSALGQLSMKKFFVYSGVSHVGFMLLAISGFNGLSDAYGATLSNAQNFFIDSQMLPVFFYLLAYNIMLLSAMLFILLNASGINYKTNRLTHYSIKDLPLFQTNPVKYILGLCLFFSFIGIPPTLGFFSKYYVLVESMAFANSMVVFLVLFIIITITGFVYGRIISNIYFRTIPANSPRYWHTCVGDSVIWSRLYVFFVGLTVLFVIFPESLLYVFDLSSATFFNYGELSNLEVFLEEDAPQAADNGVYRAVGLEVRPVCTKWVALGIPKLNVYPRFPYTIMEPYVYGTPPWLGKF